MHGFTLQLGMILIVSNPANIEEMKLTVKQVSDNKDVNTLVHVFYGLIDKPGQLEDDRNS